MKERHWISLVTSIRHGKAVLVLGPEIPARRALAAKFEASGESVTQALTTQLAAELEEDNRKVTGEALAAIAQQYEDAQGFGPNALRALAERFYNSGQFAPSDVHVALATLPFSLILTTCQDDLLCRALKDCGKEPVVQRYNLRGDKRDNAEFMLTGSPRTPVIYHLFGHAREPGSLVLSENDLLDFLVAIVSERPPLPNSLVRALKRVGQSFLFVGFGIKQWYLRVLLKVLVRSLELHRTGSAIATEPLRGLSEIDRQQTILFYQRGTRIELEDADIQAFLAELARRLASEGGLAEETASLGPRPRVFISYAREDSELAAMVFNGLQESNFEPWLDRESLRGGEKWDERIEDQLEAADFTLVLYTAALCVKTDSYINKEIALARRRALSVRGTFLIPLRAADLGADERVSELDDYQEMPLRPDHFEEDIAKVISTMRRDYQRRNRLLA